MMKKLGWIGIILVSVSALTSCSDSNESKKEVLLIEATSLFTRAASELKTYIQLSGLDLPTDQLKYNVEVFKITYKTQYKGQGITASGLVILPSTTDEIAMVSFQHGTIAAHADAPTALPLNSTELILYSALASPGFIAVIPDYLGFGASDQILHPYYVEDLTASSIIDNLKAAKDLAEQKGLHFNSKLVLAGYSQGGYATMATHKAIEANGLSGFDLRASFPAAGGYDVKGMQSTLFGLETYDNPFYIAYVAEAYKATYDWSNSLSDFFQEPYASTIPGLFDGTKSASQINAALTTEVKSLLQPDLIANIDSNPKYSYLVNAFNENSLLDWTPKVPIHLYHGSADVTVFYQNSVNTYNKLISNGASTSIVTLTSLSGATHSTGIVPYLEDAMPKIIALK